MALQDELKKNLKYGQTPIDDISGLKLFHVSTVGELFDAENINISEAVRKHSRSARSFELSTSSLRKIHLDMLGGVWDWAGEFRTTKVNLGVPWHSIQTRLKGCFDNLAYHKTEGETLIYRSAVLHHELTRIHPFKNGNGRWARLVTSVYAQNESGLFLEWPDGSTEPRRKIYIDCLRKADAGDLLPLIDLIQKRNPSISQ